MLEPSSKTEAQQREMPEPWEGTRPIPWVVITIVAGMFLWAIGYIWFTHQTIPASYGDRRTAQDFQVVAGAGSQDGAIDGGKLYATHCVACHQATGAGLAGVFPPLAGAEWVIGEPKVLIQILLHGVSGELTVQDTVYNGQMPAFGDKMNDSELAALLTHIRTDFGNTAEPIQAEMIARQREEVERDTPWQGDADLASLK